MSGRHLVAKLIKDSDLVVGTRYSDRIRMRSIFRNDWRNLIECTNVGFRWAIKVEISGVWKQFLQSAKMLDWKNLTGKEHCSKTGIIVLFQFPVLGQEIGRAHV